MIDSHCHLADEVFAVDLEAVVERARGAGLTHALVILAAGDGKEAAQAQTLETLWSGVRFSVGVHPHQAKDFTGRATDIPAVLDDARRAHPLVRAIGEIGLDYHYDFSPRAVQHEVFAVQLEYARDRDLPIVIHTREATDDTFRLISDVGRGRLRGVFHCFTGDEAMARAALDLGFHISFAGIVTFPKAPGLRAIASWVPEDRFLIETDAPFLAPVLVRGKRNEPAFVTHVADVVAEQRGTSPAETAERARRNFVELFRP